MDLLTPLFGLDPSGPEATALCVAAALLLALLVGGGFTLLLRAQHAAHTRGGNTPGDLGLLALWRLNRTVRQRRHVSPRPRLATPGAGG